MKKLNVMCLRFVRLLRRRVTARCPIIAVVSLCPAVNAGEKECSMSRLSCLAVWIVVLASCLTVRDASADYLSAVQGTASSNLWAYWQLNETGVTGGTTAVNSAATGSTYNAQWGASSSLPNTVPTSGTTGPTAADGFAGLSSSNTCAKFTGTSGADGADMLQIGAAWGAATANAVDNKLASNSLTFAFFIKTTESDTSISNLILKDRFSDSAHDFSVLLGTANGYGTTTSKGITIITNESDTANNRAASSSVTLNDGKWHHVIIVRNGDNASSAALYVDGVSQSLTANTGKYSTGNPATVGRIGSGGSNNIGSFKGALDEIALWDTSLTSTQALSLFNAATVVPEPSSMVLCGMAIVALLAYAWRKRK